MKEQNYNIVSKSSKVATEGSNAANKLYKAIWQENSCFGRTKSPSRQVPLTIRRVEGKDGEGILSRHSVMQVDYFASKNLYKFLFLRVLHW